MSGTVTAPEPASAPAPADSLAFEFELTAGDLRAAIVARGRAVRKARILNWMLVAGLVLTASGMALRVSRDGLGELAPKDYGIGIFLVLLVALQTLGLQAYLSRGRLRQHGPSRVTVDAEAVHCAGAHTVSTQAWPQFSCYLERKGLFLLLSADKRCLTVLPKRALTAPGDTDRLRALLDARLPRA
ncbi:YcxB family protein [Streptomyces roseoverticillatus]|uniref:YcxB family protein n=1 Tax=Streptomyces roseoverticillatus TaxID=66429 RepID=UPI001F48A7DE|nr:YcxB family protein [Streptomyces roseoverticillatus]MCF3106036.1 YcxB family protein [Streptomyces roseoverticillatus]